MIQIEKVFQATVLEAVLGISLYVLAFGEIPQILTFSGYL